LISSQNSEFLSSKSVSEWRVAIKKQAAIFVPKKMANEAVRHNFTSSCGDSRSSLNNRYVLLACPAIARRATADEDASFHYA